MISTKSYQIDTYKTNKRRQEVKQQLTKELLKRSPFLLGKHILNFDKYCTPHKQWDKFSRENISLTSKKPSKTLILQPRECFKSTFWSVNHIIQILVNNPNASILLVSSTATTSTLILHQVKNHLAGNDKLIKEFGIFYNKDHWNQNSIVIAQRTTLNQKEPSVMAVGKSGFITGLHFDFILWDDVAGPNDRISQAERNTTLRYFQDCWDVLKKDIGQFIVIGTRYHKHDIYNHILKINEKLPDDEKFKCLITPAYDKKTGELNFPTILSAKKLEELKTVKSGKDTLDKSSFSCQYMLEPLDDGEQIFKQFHYYDPNTAKYQVAIQFSDPAISQTGCYSASIVIGKFLEPLELKGKWGVIATSIEKRNSSKLIRDIIELHKLITSTFNIECACYMEKNGFQQLLCENTIKAALEGDYRLPITGRTTTQNKQAKIAALEPYVSQGFLLFRNDWETIGGGYDMLMQQLNNFPQDEFDGPDALAMAHLESKSRYFNFDDKKEGDANENSNNQ